MGDICKFKKNKIFNNQCLEDVPKHITTVLII